MKIHLEEKHIKWGLTAFIVIVCSIAVFFAVYRFAAIQKFISLCISVLAPFIYGLVMAYLLCPIYNFIVRSTYNFFIKRNLRFPRGLLVSKALGTLVSLVVLMIVIIGLMWMIIPGLIDSISNIISIMPESMNKLRIWTDNKLAELPQAKDMVDSWISNFTTNAIKFVTDTVLPEYSSIATSVSEGVISVLNIVKNFFIAIIICAYFLNSKDTFAAQIKKAIIATCKESTADEILKGAKFTNKTFGGFINGKIIDSIIIGIICFIVMSIFGWEYTLLISCIIGITNIIPFFGPFIGAIPSALLLLMVEPRQCFSFLIFIIILQQFDGNILGPKILGDSTGLASFWVLFAVLIGGGLFGFIGMIIGIPIFAVIYAYTSRALNKKLESRGFSSNTMDYKVDSYRIIKSKSTKKRFWGKK